MISKLRHIFRQSVIVTECSRALQNGDVHYAKKLYCELEHSRRPRLIALGGRIKLAEQNMEGAREFFERAAQLASQKKDKLHRYVLEYCTFYLSLMDNDGKHETHRERALKLKPMRSLFSALPLAPKDWEEKGSIKDPRSFF